MAYDNADKRTSLTLPNGIVVKYGYDDDSRLTGLTYKLGMSTLGTLTYGYDVNGQRTSVGGTYARTGCRRRWRRRPTTTPIKLRRSARHRSRTTTTAI